MNFNPRTHEGYDPRLHSFLNIFSYFNPRTREGYDYSLGTFLFCLYSFNPRIHKGYDKAHQKRKNKLSALIPVPMKGTIMIFLQMKSYPLIALIPVPVKGTMK